VTTLADAGPGSLRQAIFLANATPGDDTITFAVTGTINLASALPDLSSNIDIQGPGASTLTVRRNAGVFGPYFRLFTVASGVTVQIAGVTIANGYASSFLGSPLAQGGGIYNAGTLTVSNSTIYQNCALSEDSIGTYFGDGGGIANYGTLTLNSSAVS